MYCHTGVCVVPSIRFLAYLFYSRFSCSALLRVPPWLTLILFAELFMELRYGRQVRFYDMRPSSSHRIIGIPLIQTTAQKTRLYALDTIVRYANRVTLFGVRYKPYWIMSDLATFSALVYAWAFSRRFPQVSGVGLGLAVLVALLVYKLVLEVKAALGKSAARSFLQDCLLIIIPSFIAVSILLHQPMNLAFSFVGTLLPLYGCFARLGCFLAGCCYGKPSGRGIRILGLSLTRAAPVAGDTLPVLIRVYACFQYNSLRRACKQRFSQRSRYSFGTFRAWPAPSFGCISHCTQWCDSFSTSFVPPARDQDIGAFLKHRLYA